MKIAQIETFLVSPRSVLVRVETDSGLVGWGEPSLEGYGRTIMTTISEWSQWLVGCDPRRIEELWQRMYKGGFYRGGPVLCSAASGIEHALWDILGKHLGVPAYQLLGGPVRDRIRMYRWIRGDTPETTAEDARRAVDQGFTAVKMGAVGGCRWLESKATQDQACALVQAARSALPAEVDLAVDLHGRTTPALGLSLCRLLEDQGLLFVEEPCFPQNLKALGELTRATTVPVAVGERLYTRFQFRELFAQARVAVVQPDLCHAGGLWETRKIAALAEAEGVAVAPHNPLGAVSTAVCVQLDACTPNFLVQEYVTLGEEVLTTPFVLEDGYLLLPTGPGLGIEVNEEWVRSAQGDPWRTPELQVEDGAYVDW